MKPIVNSRGATIDTQQCVENSGGNKYDLILIASTRAREIRRQHKDSNQFEHTHATVSALIDIQEGRVGKEYLKRIK
jgi:DNA-directed RNA polymerase omega subunit